MNTYGKPSHDIRQDRRLERQVSRELEVSTWDLSDIGVSQKSASRLGSIYISIDASGAP